MKKRFIGDIHGDFKAYREIIKDCDSSIQVGDFGCGFQDWGWDNPDIQGDHKFIRGNHDNLSICKITPQWIPDGHWDAKHRMMFIGGAWSIDAQWRTVGKDWWYDEELAYSEFNKLIGVYDYLKPEIMVTHDCPFNVACDLFPWMHKTSNPSRTGAALQSMFDIHRPKLWIFGHHHSHRNNEIGGTRFVCLDINQWADVDLIEFS